MADLPQDIELRRFARPIGVTGLASPDGRTKHRLTTVTGSFDGVLATGVSAEPGGPPASLSYLTLAPLVAQELASRASDAGPGTPSADRLAPDDATAETESAAPEGGERRVRELLREESDGSTRSRDLRSTDLTVSGEFPRDAASEQDAGGASGGRPGRSGRSNEQSSLARHEDTDGPRGHDEPAGETDWAADLRVSEPSRTVADRSLHEGRDHDASSAPASRDDGQSGASGRRGPAQRPDGTQRGPPTTTVPTTVAHGGPPATDGSEGAPRGRSDPRDPAESDGAAPVTTQTGGRSPAATHTDGRIPGDDRGGLSLTVTGPGVSGTSTATGADAVDGPGGDGSSGAATGSLSEGTTGDDGVAARTVVRSDGRLNERVFDRLYEEVSRKMRLERDREGR